MYFVNVLVQVRIRVQQSVDAVEVSIRPKQPEHDLAKEGAAEERADDRRPGADWRDEAKRRQTDVPDAAAQDALEAATLLEADERGWRVLRIQLQVLNYISEGPEKRRCKRVY